MVLRSLCIVLALWPAAPTSAQLDAFRYDPKRVPVGRVYQYLKSNRDGSHAGKALWVDGQEGHIVEFELPIPDEPGLVDGRLRLLEVTAMTGEEWEAYKIARVGG